MNRRLTVQLGEGDATVAELWDPDGRYHVIVKGEYDVLKVDDLRLHLNRSLNLRLTYRRTPHAQGRPQARAQGLHQRPGPHQPVLAGLARRRDRH